SRHSEIHPAKIGRDRCACLPQRITRIETGCSKLTATNLPRLLFYAHAPCQFAIYRRNIGAVFEVKNEIPA
ncbi:MAG: hypothetical protein WBC04_22315, partial [Candidatus Acidiferrales bacterium]